MTEQLNKNNTWSFSCMNNADILKSSKILCVFFETRLGCCSKAAVLFSDSLSLIFASLPFPDQQLFESSLHYSGKVMETSSVPYKKRGTERLLCPGAPQAPAWFHTDLESQPLLNTEEKWLVHRLKQFYKTMKQDDRILSNQTQVTEAQSLTPGTSTSRVEQMAVMGALELATGKILSVHTDFQYAYTSYSQTGLLEIKGYTYYRE